MANTQIGLNRKLERAFVDAVYNVIAPNYGTPLLTGYWGLGDYNNRSLPFANIFCSSIEENPAFPPNSGEYVAKMVLHLAFQVDDQNGVSFHDEQQYIYESAIKDVSAMKAEVNKPVGTDNRVIKGLYIYDIKEDSETHDFKLSGERTIDDIYTYTVPCRNDDGDGT